MSTATTSPSTPTGAATPSTSTVGASPTTRTAGATPSSSTARREELPVLRLAPAPRAEPAADGRDWGQFPGVTSSRPTRSPSGAGPGGYVQGALAMQLPTPPQEVDDVDFGPQSTGTADLPDAEAWARRLIRATLEVCDGSRSADQLTRWLTPEIRERVARRGVLARRRGRRAHRPPAVRTVLTCHPADGVCEVSAVIHADGRVRALALRMSGADGRWLVTALEIG